MTKKIQNAFLKTLFSDYIVLFVETTPQYKMFSNKQIQNKNNIYTAHKSAKFS